ncbi:MAG: TIGR03905 family TSCPD domain-containing protein [Oscillospiraceae bacterium]|jgi:uncharacterized protein (TIGR03905 family)|nr:TIGR03905 family TSCPD domain-containing protein [Oscillospiraceae bacterium]
MKTIYPTKGVCASSITIDTDGGIVRSVEFEGGCDGNSSGIESLVKGMKIDEVIERLGGIRCGRKDTSCPDQLAKALQSVRDAA